MMPTLNIGSNRFFFLMNWLLFDAFYKLENASNMQLNFLVQYIFYNIVYKKSLISMSILGCDLKL